MMLDESVFDFVERLTLVALVADLLLFQDQHWLLPLAVTTTPEEGLGILNDEHEDAEEHERNPDVTRDRHHLMSTECVRERCMQ